MVKGGVTLNVEMPVDYETDTANNKLPTKSMVTAYDSVGTATGTTDNASNATVTINVNNEDEKPTFGAMDATTGCERYRSDWLMSRTQRPHRRLIIATYVAMDPEGEIVTLSLMGDDAGLFELAADTVTDANNVSQALSFKKSPDFEMPGDRNTDNLYEVTIRASDGTLNADRMVVVKVNNVDEDRNGDNISGEPDGWD